MFTGIIHCLGDVVSRRGTAKESRFTIAPRSPFTAPEIGESIAVNGICLTAERFDNGTFTAYASGETLAVTTLASLIPGSPVNLERAVAVGSRLGGHIVSGHVDCIATVTAVTQKGDSTIFRIGFPDTIRHLLVPKGSVALDGVSLTINECGRDSLTVNCIPETLGATILRSWKVGTKVNLETDILGKYVARMLETGYLHPAGTARDESTGLTLEFLQKHGF